jgi:hypothetical protein
MHAAYMQGSLVMLRDVGWIYTASATPGSLGVLIPGIEKIR